MKLDWFEIHTILWLDIILWFDITQKWCPSYLQNSKAFKYASWYKIYWIKQT